MRPSDSRIAVSPTTSSVISYLLFFLSLSVSCFQMPRGGFIWPISCYILYDCAPLSLLCSCSITLTLSSNFSSATGGAGALVSERAGDDEGGDFPPLVYERVGDGDLPPLVGERVGVASGGGGAGTFLAVLTDRDERLGSGKPCSLYWPKVATLVNASRNNF